MTQLQRGAVALFALLGLAATLGCGGASPAPQPTPTPQPGNSSPSAAAGQAQTVVKGQAVTLDGTASADADGDRLVYRWSQVAGPAVTLSDPAAAKPSFTAPRASGTLTFALVVGDGKVESAPASVDVTVRDRAPVASSGTAALTTGAGHVVLLDGRGSWDPDGDALSYAWRQTSGDVAVAVQDWHDGTVTFTAPASAAPVTLGFALTVSDGELTSSAATAIVLVLPPGTTLPPTVSAGADQTVARRSTVILHGSASDPQNLVLGVKWTQVDGPAVALSASPYYWDPSSASFSAPAVECDLTFRLTADDGVASASDDVVVHVVNFAPMIASASLAPSAPTTLDALTASVVASDPDGDPVALAYGWKRNGVLIAGATGPTLAGRQAVRGDAVAVVVTASDGKLSTTAETSVTILDAPPVLAAAAPTRVTHGQTVSFQVTASDPDGDPVGDLALEYGPAGMDVTPGGLVTWTATEPMFDRAQDFRWSVVAKAQPAGRLTGTITVEDPQRQYPLRRTGLGVPASHAGLRVTDLDGDGVAEALIASSEGVYELARSGGGYVQRWMYPFAPGAESVQAVAAGDVDADGKQELFFAAGTLVVELDGASRREVARYDAAPPSCVDLAVADIDRDGQAELVCLASQSSYYPSGGTSQVIVLDARSLAVKWSTPQLALGSSLAVGNVDADPALEIVTAGGFVFDGKTQANEWAYGPGFGDLVDVGDLDGTGVAQIVGMQSWGKFSGFSAVYKSPLWDASRFNPGAVRVADVDGDGKAEVLVGDAQWGSVTAYRYDAAKNAVTVALDLLGIFGGTSYDAVRALDVGDVDGDGAREIVFGAGGTTAGGMALAIAGSAAPATLEWASAMPVLDHPFVGARPARIAAGGPTTLLYAAPSTNGGYDGTRLVALDPATGLLKVSAEVGSNWNRRAALDVADYDHDGVVEALLTTANLYDGYFVAYDFARDAVEWTSGTGTGTFGGLGVGVAVAHADLNGDGFDDLVVMTSGGYVYAYDVKNQTLIWKSTGLGGSGVDVAVADVDGDGVPEIVALGSTRVVVYRKVPTPVAYVEAAAYAMTGALDLAVADCDGDGKPEVYVLANGGYGSGPTGVTRLDGALQALGSFTLDAPAQSLHVEDLGPGRKNLLVGMGSSYSYYPYTAAPSYLRAIDARTGAEVWRSPPLWGPVSANSLSYVDLAGDGRRQIAFATASGMYVTR